MLKSSTFLPLSTAGWVLTGVMWLVSDWRSGQRNADALAASNAQSAKLFSDVQKLSDRTKLLSEKLQQLETNYKAMAVRAAAVPKRPWGPEQVTGEPNVFEAGDNSAAWASLTQDDQPEWLMLEYDEAIKIVAVKVYETYNPGALAQISVIDAEGVESVAWTGKDPTEQGTGKGVSVIALNARFTAKKIKLYFDSPAVSGWNEIDAVGLVDPEGKTHWAVTAEASSTYAEPNGTSKSADTIPQANDFNGALF